MKLDNLSKHGILTGSIIIIFLSIMTILAADKIHDITNLAETYRDFNEFDQNPPPSLDEPVGVIVVSLILIFITGLMILGIIKESLLCIAPWLIIFSLAAASEILFFVHQLVTYFSTQLLLFMLCIIGVQLLIFSPIVLIFHSILCKARDNFKTNLQQDTETNSSQKYGLDGLREQPLYL